MRRRFAVLALFLLLLTFALGAEDPSLVKLRKALAQRYVEPDPHMALARYYLEKGNRLQAFSLLESVRRGLFPQEQFDEAFERAFSKREPFDNSKKAEAELLKKLAQNPKSAETAIRVADVYISRDDWKRAREYLAKAIELNPEDFTAVAAMGEVLRREDKPKEAEQVVKDFFDKYPQSKEAYLRKITPLMRSDPAAARKLLEEAIQKFPQDGQFLFNRGVLLQDEKKLKEAEEQFVKAATLAKDSAHVQGWTGRFFLKVKEDESKALHYYLNAYFLDPHFYDSEHAERRIGKISAQRGAEENEKLLKAGKKLEELSRHADPIVAGMAVDELAKKWDRKHLSVVLEALGHDDEYMRAKALRALMTNLDRSYDKDVKALLQDSDLRKKGMAAYLAVKLWGKEGVKEVAPWLKEEAQLLRYDALSVLLEHGGEEGRAIIKEHQTREKHPWLKKWLVAMTADK